MPRIRTPKSPLETARPCPGCSYDLSGHLSGNDSDDDVVKCPECGESFRFTEIHSGKSRTCLVKTLLWSLFNLGPTAVLGFLEFINRAYMVEFTHWLHALATLAALALWHGLFSRLAFRHVEDIDTRDFLIQVGTWGPVLLDILLMLLAPAVAY